MNRQGRRFHGSADVTSVPLGQDRAGIGLFNGSCAGQVPMDP